MSQVQCKWQWEKKEKTLEMQNCQSVDPWFRPGQTDTSLTLAERHLNFMLCPQMIQKMFIFPQWKSRMWKSLIFMLVMKYNECLNFFREEVNVFKVK